MPDAETMALLAPRFHNYKPAQMTSELLRNQASDWILFFVVDIGFMAEISLLSDIKWAV